MDLIQILSGVYEKKIGCLEDNADILYSHTALFLFAYLSLISIRQYVFTPIACITVNGQSHLSGWLDFVENYCWIQGLSVIQGRMPDGVDEWKTVPHIGYYQWVPCILLIQCLLFYLPRRLWQAIQQIFIDVHTKDDYIEFILTAHHNYLILCYVFIKCLCIFSCSIQLILIKYLFNVEVFQLVTQLLQNKESISFPRVAYCQIIINQVGVSTSHTAQCALPLNMLNEKIFLCIWFWLIILLFVLLIHCIKWVYYFCNSKFYKRLRKATYNTIFILHMLSIPKAIKLSAELYCLNADDDDNVDHDTELKVNTLLSEVQVNNELGNDDNTTPKLLSDLKTTESYFLNDIDINEYLTTLV